MAKSRDWTEILVRRGVIGPDQLKEAERSGGAVEDALVKLGYADADDIVKAKAEQHGLAFIELREVEPRVWRRLLVPGSVRLDKLHRMFQAAMGILLFATLINGMNYLHVNLPIQQLLYGAILVVALAAMGRIGRGTIPGF